MDTRETYNTIARDWHEDHKSDDWWVGGMDAFISLLPDGAVVLDAGCGGGFNAAYLIEHGVRIVGIDYSEKLIEIAREEVSEGEFILMDMQDVHDIGQSFNGIFMKASLLHIPKKDAPNTLRGLNELLMPGGYFYVAVKEKRAEGPDEEVKEENDYGYTYSRFFSYFTRDELKKYFSQLGLEVVYEDVHASGKTNWLQIIAQK